MTPEVACATLAPDRTPFGAAAPRSVWDCGIAGVVERWGFGVPEHWAGRDRSRRFLPAPLLRPQARARTLAPLPKSVSHAASNLRAFLFQNG